MPRPPKLTVAQVRYLRKRRAVHLTPGNRKKGIPEKKLAERLGITKTAMWQAAIGITYKQVRP